MDLWKLGKRVHLRNDEMRQATVLTRNGDCVWALFDDPVPAELYSEAPPATAVDETVVRAAWVKYHVCLLPLKLLQPILGEYDCFDIHPNRRILAAALHRARMSSIAKTNTPSSEHTRLANQGVW